MGCRLESSQELNENIVYSELQQGCPKRHNKKGQNKAELTLVP